MIIRISRRAIYALITLAAAVSVVYASTTLFTHTFPAVTVTPAPAAIGTNCASIALTATPTSAVSGSSGFIVFSCGASGAFIIGPSGGTTTPTFSLPAGYTSLQIQATPVANTGCTGAILTSGSPVTFSSALAGVEVNYCGNFSSAPSGGFATFTVTWTQ